MRFARVVVLLAAVSSVAVTGSGSAPAADKISKSCTLKGKKLFGKVKVVEHFPDFKVKAVEHFPDLEVQVVQHFPDACGKWQLVEHFPDFTIQYVEHFPDFTVRRVEHFPGLPN